MQVFITLGVIVMLVLFVPDKLSFWKRLFELIVAILVWFAIATVMLLLSIFIKSK